MVAARDIKPLELLLWEQAAVVGPYSKNGSGCLQCLKKVDGSYLCSGCQFPMCNAECEKSPFHQDECLFFQDKDRSANRRFSKTHNGATASSSPLWITPLRMLLKKKSDQKMYNRINMLRDHTAPKECDNLSNAENLKQVSIQMLNVVMLLQDASLGIEEFSQQEIHVRLINHTGAKIRNLFKNSHFENLIFDKIHNFKVLYSTKFTFPNFRFSQNSYFSNIKFWGIFG